MDELERLYITGKIPEECLFELSDGRAEDDYLEPVGLYEDIAEHERD